MTALDVVLALVVGLAAGVLSGLFGVGGGIAMTPGVQVLLATRAITALATPLPVIIPTAITGAARYRAAGELDPVAARWMGLTGFFTAIGGALLTKVIEPDFLLLVTAILLGWQSISLLLGARSTSHGGTRTYRSATPAAFAAIGVLAGLTSGLLGVGGGLIMVPLLSNWLGMPLRRALGTSLAAMLAMVIPGTVVHAFLGHVDWLLALVLTVGAVPGARIGAGIALGSRERTLRIAVGGFLLAAAILYGAKELVHLIRG
ncbi:MAG: sulfite exporter TauE/SafE family protein [Actinomycetota bacterium]